MKLRNYNFGLDIVNGFDVSEKQVNYSTKYSSDARGNQKKLLRELRIEEFFDQRIDLGCVHGDKIVVVRDFSFSEDSNPISGCDGVITDVSNLPLISSSGDCAMLLVVGKKFVGLLHCSVATVDLRIIDKFFDKFCKFERVEDLRVGFSPYIFQEDLFYNKLNLVRNDLSDFILRKDDGFYLGLGEMVKFDLKKVGILDKNVKDLKINTFDLSRGSLLCGGYQISHREYSLNPMREGRMGLCLMKK